jgi:hypothetical protein
MYENFQSNFTCGAMRGNRYRIVQLYFEFLHAKTRDREAFRKDLEWVLAQDPHKALTPYPWSVYYQREAKIMLEQNK